MLTEGTGATKPVTVIILGADALLAARPATPIQLWHACAEAGYDLAVPATWGDELIAGECVRTIGSHPEHVAVMCTCPMVARALAGMPLDLSGHLVATVAPPVATAKYVRRVYGDRRVHITYAGACPAAADSAIDAWITPAELLERFRATEILLGDQPELFESILPPDRRRHLSQPGGLPAPEHIASLQRPRRLQQIDDANLVAALEAHLASGLRTLVDFAPRVGCACSGVADGTPSGEARTAVTLLEPPRSARPVLPDPGGLGLSRRLPVRPSVPPIEPAVRPVVPLPPEPSARPEHERPAAVATRALTRSPLSWHLRERALPQPPTTARPEHRRTPDSGRAVGASSAAWAAAAHRRKEGATQADAVTAAAVRALEQAAALRSDEAGKARADAPGAAGSSEAPAAPGRRHGAEERSPAASHDVVAPRSPATEAASEERGTASGLAAQRATPTGGYWFAAPIVTGPLDAEVRRPSSPVVGVPDDVLSIVDEVPDDIAPSVNEPRDEVAAPETGRPDVAAAPGRGGPGGGPGEEPSPARVHSEDEAVEYAPAAAGMLADAPANVGSPALKIASSPGGVVEPIDDVRAELDALFSRNERSATAPSDAGPGASVETTPTVPATPDASGSAAPPATDTPATPATPAIQLPTVQVPGVESQARAASSSGPLPWKWLIGAALLVVAAVAISRRINSRVTTEESGTSAMAGGAASRSGLLPGGALPGGGRDDESPARLGSAGSAGPAPDSGVRRPRTTNSSRSPGTTQTRRASPASRSTERRMDSLARDSAAGAVAARLDSARLDSIRRDSLWRDSAARARAPAVVPPGTPRAPEATARELELQAIRDELARRTARLDSMGRALGSLYVTPRRSPPAQATRPPSARPPIDPRDRAPTDPRD